MTKKDLFNFEERNKRLELMAEYFDNHEVTIEDMLAVVCANILNNGGGCRNTRLMVAGHEFNITFEEVN